MEVYPIGKPCAHAEEFLDSFRIVPVSEIGGWGTSCLSRGFRSRESTPAHRDDAAVNGAQPRFFHAITPTNDRATCQRWFCLAESKHALKTQDNANDARDRCNLSGKG
jgi:hypothetical protein